MIYLLLSILFSTATVCMFKVFERNGVDTFEAIVFNYLTCSVIGNILAPQTIFTQQVWQMPWFPFTLVLGLLFITIFNFIAQTAQKIGVAVSMVAAKLSVAVPVAAAILLYAEPIHPIRIAGILVSMIAVYFISKKQEGEANHNSKLWYLPLVVFAGSGCIDTLINFVEQKYIPPSDAASVICTVFTVACIIGLGCLAYRAMKHKKYPTVKNGGWGILLGIPNYFSMYFLLKTLGNFDGSYIFPLNNIGIVAASAIIAVIAFHEKLSTYNKAGLALAIVSILLISFG